MLSKLLVIGGSHKRENDFSYPVIDALIQYFGQKEPDYNISTESKSESGSVWIYDKIVLAKVYKQEIETLEHLGNGCCVHDELLDLVNPNLVIDLHSFHKFCKDLEGTGMGISLTPNIDETQEAYLKRLQSMQKVVRAAKKDFPETYGYLNKKSESLGELMDRVTYEILKSEGAVEAEEELPDYFRKLQKELEFDELIELQEKFFKEAIKQFGNRYEISVTMPGLGEDRPKSKRPYTDGMLKSKQYYIFEAVHWGENARETVKKFILEYVLPNLSMFKK